MAKVLITIQSEGEAPSLESVKARYDLKDHEADADFGVVAIDPDAGMYTMLVEEHVAERMDSSGDWNVEGPFSNPQIETFGL